MTRPADRASPGDPCPELTTPQRGKTMSERAHTPLTPDDQQLRLACLKLAASQDLSLGGDVLKLARDFLAFVTGEEVADAT